MPRAVAAFFAPAVQSSGTFETARVDEINRTGGASEDLYSGNFHWSTTLLSLPGRAGHDLNLPLSYNSLVWLKAAGAMQFDHDAGWPSPGFHLGFPTFFPIYYTNTQTGLQSYKMITSSGRVVELRRVTSAIYEARDGSLTRLTFNTSGYPVLTMRDGTTYTYGQTLDIKDRNGNLITVSFTQDGLYNTITDTLGRVITFNYGTYNDLQTITQTWEGMTKTLVTFSYDNNFQIFTNFGSLALDNITNGYYVPVLYQVDLIDGTRYNFQYNTYGQVTKIELRGGSFLRSWVSYNLPANQGAGAQNHCPRFTQRSDWAYEWNAGTVYTNFCFSDSTCPWTVGHSVGKATTPDGTTQREVFATTGWQRGLTTQSETWAGGRQKWTTL